ncbi:MAG TPA: hypothetical protein VMF91_26865 [Bryobacteraceae bacterium]|nr:hypothetical protein [Bryobacteraceae bacterium]
MRERRTDPRLLCAELVQVVWKDPSGHCRRRVANLEDISLTGICLQMEGLVPEGTLLSMQYGDGQLVGTVRYCVFRDNAYFLGIRFEEGCRWSTRHFRPEHLLDPRELVEQAIQRYESNSEPLPLQRPA